jgi:hypothetical protein
MEEEWCLLGEFDVFCLIRVEGVFGEGRIINIGKFN